MPKKTIYDIDDNLLLQHQAQQHHQLMQDRAFMEQTIFSSRRDKNPISQLDEDRLVDIDKQLYNLDFPF